MTSHLTDMTTTSTLSKFEDTLSDFTDTGRSSLVKFNQSTGSLLIRSTPAIGDPVNELVVEHLKTNDKLSVFFYFCELKPGLIKVLFDLFKTMRSAHLQGKEISVCWLLEVNDEEMIETAMNFSDIYELNMELIPR